MPGYMGFESVSEADNMDAAGEGGLQAEVKDK